MAQTMVRTYGPRKAEAVEKVCKLAQSHKVMAISRLHKVRASQLMALRKNLKSEMTILVVKNRVAALGLKKAGLDNIEEFTKVLEGQNALIFTNLNPFKLYLILEKNKVNLMARAGDVVSEDVIVPAGNTGLPPGPVISEFKEAKVPTKIDTGSIWVTKDTVVLRKGEVVTPVLASLLARLGIKPIQAGLSIVAAYSEGKVLHEEDVRLDIEEYRKAICDAEAMSWALSLAISYPTSETMPLLLMKGRDEAVTLAYKAGYLTKETAGQLLAESELKALALYELLKNKGYS